MTSKRVVMITVLSFLLIFVPHSARAELDPRIKALGTMAAYGTIGGALLGTASLAFGTSGRSIAKGASLGLYAGLIFGTYVVVSHAWRKRSSSQSPVTPQDDNYYPDSEGTYESDPYGGTYDRWDPYIAQEEMRLRLSQSQFKIGPGTQKKEGPDVYLPLVHFQF